MDATYFDLYIKYKDAEKEVVWERGITWGVLEMYLRMIREINKVDIKLFGKSKIEYIRIE